MTDVLTDYEYCTVTSETLTYTLDQYDGNPLDDWMTWDATTMTLSGLVPKPQSSYERLTMTGTDTNGNSASSSFYIYYQSKPYLNIPIPYFSIRTQEAFSY